MTHLIDVHHHVLPDFYVEAIGVERLMGQAPKSSRAALDWQPRSSLDEMDTHGVSAAVVSVSAPGVSPFEQQPAARLARRCNDFMATLVQQHSPRFGMFAILPLHDVDTALAEIEHACDQLHTDGFGILSSYDGQYPGDARFAPVFDELHRRRAVVFLHPTMPVACRDLLPGIPPSSLEFPLDTTRAITSLLYGGVLSRCPGIRFIFPHAGGALSSLAHRICRLEQMESFAEKTQGIAMELLARQYYDTALSANPSTLAALERLVPHGKILYGSDYPFARGMMGRTLQGLDEHGFSADALQAIHGDNAAPLFPALTARLVGA